MLRTGRAKRLEEIEKKAAESDLIGKLATDPKACPKGDGRPR